MASESKHLDIMAKITLIYWPITLFVAILISFGISGYNEYKSDSICETLNYTDYDFERNQCFKIQEIPVTDINNNTFYNYDRIYSPGQLKED